MASNIAVKISLPIAPSIANARDRPARGALVASRLVNRNALTEFLGQAQASGILGVTAATADDGAIGLGDLMLSRLASECRLAGSAGCAGRVPESVWETCVGRRLTVGRSSV